MSKPFIDDKFGRTIKYAWYSVRQAALGGVVVWRNSEGKEIECTCVTSTMTHDMKWDDLSLVGEVITFVSRKSGGLLDLNEGKRLDAHALIDKLDKLMNIAEVKPKQNLHRWN